MAQVGRAGMNVVVVNLYFVYIFLIYRFGFQNKSGQVLKILT